MAGIAPFRGVRYNTHKVGDLSKVVTQPYDRIGPELQEEYYALHPYNLVRLIQGRKHEDDTAEQNAYTRAREYYQAWIDAGYLLREGELALYVYWQTFTLPDGGTRTRKALVAALQLVEFSEGIVLPHERTLSGPKIDRLNLMRATAFDFEQIFMLYPDSENRINALLDAAIAGKAPDEDVQELFERDVRQQLWVVDDADVVASVVAEMAPKTGLIIADGHHRYETALNYRNEMRENHPEAPADAAFNRVMICFVSMDDPGLVILPTHRLIYGYHAKAPNQIMEDASAYFEVTPLAGREELMQALAKGTQEDRRLGFYDGRYFLLRLKSRTIMDELVPERAAEWRQLDVSILHELLIERVMGITKKQVEAKEHLDYYRDLDEALARVDSGEGTCVFILSPTRIGEVKACSDRGEKMPQKSTDFYPKMISGMVMMDIGLGERL